MTANVANRRQRNTSEIVISISGRDFEYFKARSVAFEPYSELQIPAHTKLQKKVFMVANKFRDLNLK